MRLFGSGLKDSKGARRLSCDITCLRRSQGYVWDQIKYDSYM